MNAILQLRELRLGGVLGNWSKVTKLADISDSSHSEASAFPKGRKEIWVAYEMRMQSHIWLRKKNSGTGGRPTNIGKEEEANKLTV